MSSTEFSNAAVVSQEGSPKSVMPSPFFIEICAGSARVTSCLQHLGLSASFGVDHKLQKNAGRVLVADLTSPDGQDLCNLWLSSPNLAGVFVAPPCGTCSRARGIPVKLPNGKIVQGPQPLRSDVQPNGLSDLSWINRQRVSSANKLYHYVTHVALNCIQRNLIVCIENPRSSLYWKTTFFQPLVKHLNFTAHQACAYGSQRPKWTVLAHNTRTLHSLNQVCPGEAPGHHHKPWGVVGTSGTFSTSEETAYPPLLAYHIAYHLAMELVQRGWSPPFSEFAMPDNVSYQYLRAVVGIQPKASKIAPLVSEFGQIVHISVPEGVHPPVRPGEKLSHSWQGLPVHSCLLKRPPLRITGGMITKASIEAPSSKLVDANCRKNLCFGVYRSGHEFVRDAAEAGHPIGRDAMLPTALSNAIRFVSSKSQHEVAMDRHSTLTHWLGRAEDLVGEERAFHDSLPGGVQSILAPKRLLLWREMLMHYGYPDISVFDEVVNGTDLVGAVPAMPYFDASFKPAKMTVEELGASATSIRKSLLASIRSSGDADIDHEVYSKTLDELGCGWLEGPIEPGSLPSLAIVSRRFGIKQTSGETTKIRLIDDFSASGVNSTVQVENAPKLHTLDVVAALCMELLRAGPGEQLVGKTVDLSSAYRQLGISPGSKWVSYIAVYDPNSKSPKIFSMKALPFGASRSVYSFLRVAHSLWWLGATALHFIWSSFFDDFVTLARRSESQAVDIAVSQFFKLLGWATSSGDKDLPFDVRFKALGVEVDLSEWQSGKAAFRNTAKRVDELVKTITDVLEKGL